jgi:outer membrane receptor protein involved in Fe transport
VVEGAVVDGDLGEGLPGANVVITGTANGTATDFDGQYRLTLTPGQYDLSFSYIGYVTKTVTGVHVAEGQTVSLSVDLALDAVGLDEVVVEAEAAADAEGALLAARAKSAGMSDAISAETISRSGSSDAAAAMSKVTGASVVGGKYVYVRGLGDRYANAHLNGSTLPTADPDRKAVQFDLFPANLLDNIVTVKTFTPDKPGNFSGGLVDIATKSFPSQFTFNFSANAGYNTNTSLADSFLTYSGGDRDWLGEDDGTRSVPEAVEDPEVPIPSSASSRFDPESAARLNEASKSFNNLMGNTVTTGPMNQSYSLSLGNRLGIGEQDAIGYVLGLTYSNKASYYADGQTERWAVTGADTDALLPTLLLRDSRGTREVSLGVLANVAYQLGGNNKFSLNTMYTRSGDEESRFQVGQWEEIDITDPNSKFISRTLGWIERELVSGQVRGEHYFPALLNSEINWSASYGRTTMDDPDRRFVANTERVVGNRVIRSLSASGFRDPSRYYRNLDETINDFQLNWELPIAQGNRGFSGQLKFGGSAQFTDRDFAERSFEIRPNSAFEFDGDVFNFFQQENAGVVDIDTLRDGRLRFGFGNVVVDATKLKNQYSGQRDIVAGYGMVDALIGQKVRVIAGARVEGTDLAVVSQDTLAAQGAIKETDILPSLSLVFHLSERMNLRAAATRTLARPTFREIAPFESFDFLLGNFIIGNPVLERSLIWNADLRWEWFARPGEIFATSLFYKDLENPIERAIAGGTNGQIIYQNVPEAIVYGIELEARSSLDRIASTLRHFSIGANVTISRSQIDIPGEYDEEGNLIGGELFARRLWDPDAETRELQGQSPFLINANLGYENYQSGTYVGLHYNIFGRRLSQVSIGGTPDVFEAPVSSLDFTFSQVFMTHWKVKFGIRNVLNPDIKETYRTRSREEIYQSFSRGRTVGIGISYSI